ncbi:hypothetical protein GN956_G16937 [Arapaima gigas]
MVMTTPRRGFYNGRWLQAQRPMEPNNWIYGPGFGQIPANGYLLRCFGRTKWKQRARRHRLLPTESSALCTSRSFSFLRSPARHFLAGGILHRAPSRPQPSRSTT